MKSLSTHPHQRRAWRGRPLGRTGSSSQTVLLGIIWAMSLILAGFVGFFVGNSSAPGPVGDTDRDAGEQPSQSGSATSADGKAQPPEASPQDQLRQDIGRAITLLDEGRFEMFLQDYLSRRDLERLGGQLSEAARRADADEVAELRQHFTASLDGEFQFSQDGQLAEISYVLKAPQFVPERAPEVAESELQVPVEISSLGTELPTVLTRAAQLLRDERFEEFIGGMYPLATLSELGSDGIEQLVFRIKSNPEMSEAMLRDLQAAAEAEIQANASGDEATLVLPALAEGDPERTVKFDKVENSWRFHDADREVRNEYGRLMAQPLAAYTIPGLEGMLRFERDGDHWRLREPPQTEPITE